MGCFGVSHILKNEVVWPKRVYSMDAYFRFSTSSFLVKEALLPPEFGEGLAWEAGNVDVHSTFWIDMWVVPSILFQGGGNFPI